ncbi:hypothetical protein DsansV1_C31g0216221 [Dioscorea sansibarensis]
MIDSKSKYFFFKKLLKNGMKIQSVPSTFGLLGVCSLLFRSPLKPRAPSQLLFFLVIYCGS